MKMLLVFYAVLRNNLAVSVSRDGKDPAMGSCLLVGKKTLRYKDRPTITINCTMMNLIQRHERLIGAVPTSFDKSRIPFSECLWFEYVKATIIIIYSGKYMLKKVEIQFHYKLQIFAPLSRK